MEEFTRLLGDERLLLERLVFRMVELRALLVAGECRFLPWAAHEVDVAAARLREAELRRALAVHRLAAESGVDDGALSLRMLARTTPAPYAAIFADQHRAFRSLTTELRACVADCGALAGDGASLVSEVLERVTGADVARRHDSVPVPRVYIGNTPFAPQVVKS